MRPRSAERVTRKPVSTADALFALENGARMDQPTFHALYERTPEAFTAELIGGTVYVMASPVSALHGVPHARLVYWLCSYAAQTEWTEVGDNTTNILSATSEPQPDAYLRIDVGSGGTSRIDRKGYVVGPPELVAEVAHSSASIDLGAKKADYEAAGVREYIVVLVHEAEVRWFSRGPSGMFDELTPSSDGVISSAVFPGLRLTARSFFATRPTQLLRVLNDGLASPEHAAFVAELAARRKAAKKPRKSK